MKTVLITGFNGFIGRHLSHHLSKLGHEILGLGHVSGNQKGVFDLGLQKWVIGNIDKKNLRKVCHRKKPEIIFHLAGGATVSQAEQDPERDFFKNVISTSELLEWIRLDSPESKLIVASSASVYGQGFNGPISEDFIGTPYSVYARNKNKMETLCKSYKKNFNINYIIVRLFSVYGPNLKKQLLWELCNRIEKIDIPLVLGGTGKEVRDWVYINDLVNILTSIGLDYNKINKYSILNIGTGVGFKINEILYKVLKNWNKGEDLYKKYNAGFSGINREGDPHSLIADTARLNELGLSCKTPIQEGISNYVEWFKKIKKI